MRRSPYITIPVSLWEHPDLTAMEKAMMVEILSQCSDDGRCRQPAGKLAATLCLSRKAANDLIASLREKGAVEASLDRSGNTLLAPMLGRKRYLANAPVPAAPDSPSLFPEQQEQQAIDYDEVLAQWLRFNPTLQQPKKFTPKMQQQLRNLLRNNKVTLDDLYKVFQAVSCSDFLNGKIGHRDWKATLHWLIQDTKSCFSRIVEGEFHRTERERIALDEIFCGQPKASDDPDLCYR